MTSQLSCLENLPNEILDEIVSYLPVDTPSESNFHHTPRTHFTASSTQNLKNAAQISSRLLELVRSRLYAHSRFYLDDLYDFLNFVTSHRLERYITSLVVLLGNDPPRDLDINRLLRHLSNLNPLQITVLAPPSRIGTMLNTKAPEEHNWAFQITHQLCQWERSIPPESPVFTTNPSSNPLDIMAYSSLRFNEGSSLRAYAHYEYFLFEVPSVLGKWGTIASMGTEEEKLSISRGLRHLTSFSYTAIFPFYNHVKLVLDALELMMNLQSFTVQLAPCSEDSAIDLANRGPIDPNDPWMELATGYDIIAHSIIELGRSASLVHFRTLDYQNEALRVELSQSLGAKFKDTEWEMNGHGEWTKTASNGGIKNRSSNTGRMIA
ncbi:F-box domain protein [Aspergillus violaceofuscus CBS 115571]|uniref:F-box domain protein n=1 Tax=Aspergillus violaceofuscus (strain CBS 115571) TaxID=1450538 RepID=A0A2V5HZF4_ASPV1|nr:F-box domain protein [Aspergillus violaceofuscus CBS 115571]